MLNKTNVAGPLGVSVPTISQWLSMLEVTGQILLIPPFYENFGKRLVKTPKLYFADPGLLCHLLGIPDEKGLRTSPFLGAILENYVAAEVVKHRLNRGKGRDLYYFRDRQGLEVDFLLDQGNRKVSLLEVKATRTPMPGDGAAMAHLMGKMQPYQVSAFLLHTRPGKAAEPSPLNKGITALGISRIHDVM
jgi:predicted AAA+ superfamily ATPase